ncbi:MAG: replication initiation protein, partial [Oscillospiraceae bacterium]
SYTKLNQTLVGLKSKCWWITLADGETESAVSWFNVVRTNKRSGKVTIKLHEDMMPYLIDLKKQSELGAYFTDYELQYILPMKSQYGARLYELLKSYQKNNKQWYFDVDDLKKKLDCANSYANYADFSRYVLVPAITDINKYSDIIIEVEPQKTGKKFTHITFFMDVKTNGEHLATEQAIKKELDGQIDFDELQKEYSKNSESKFWKERYEVHKQGG